ncbi:MAG: hypothetical protein IPL35_07105 [Sphingobacteriales bacterium]|nr:hypothetical protein [Sphingobacteriales bacterium]
MSHDEIRYGTTAGYECLLSVDEGLVCKGIVLYRKIITLKMSIRLTLSEWRSKNPLRINYKQP